MRKYYISYESGETTPLSNLENFFFMLGITLPSVKGQIVDDNGNYIAVIRRIY